MKYSDKFCLYIISIFLHLNSLFSLCLCIFFIHQVSRVFLHELYNFAHWFQTTLFLIFLLFSALAVHLASGNNRLRAERSQLPYRKNYVELLLGFRNISIKIGIINYFIIYCIKLTFMKHLWFISASIWKRHNNEIFVARSSIFSL